MTTDESILGHICGTLGAALIVWLCLIVWGAL